MLSFKHEVLRGAPPVSPQRFVLAALSPDGRLLYLLTHSLTSLSAQSLGRCAREYT